MTAACHLFNFQGRRSAGAAKHGIESNKAREFDSKRTPVVAHQTAQDRIGAFFAIVFFDFYASIDPRAVKYGCHRRGRSARIGIRQGSPAGNCRCASTITWGGYRLPLPR